MPLVVDLAGTRKVYNNPKLHNNNPKLVPLQKVVRTPDKTQILSQYQWSHLLLSGILQSSSLPKAYVGLSEKLACGHAL